MSSSKPVLGSYSGYPSMINEAGCGYFIPSEDVSLLVKKIKEIASMNENQRIAIGKKRKKNG